MNAQNIKKFLKYISNSVELKPLTLNEVAYEISYFIILMVDVPLVNEEEMFPCCIAEEETTSEKQEDY